MQSDIAFLYSQQDSHFMASSYWPCFWLSIPLVLADVADTLGEGGGSASVDPAKLPPFVKASLCALPFFFFVSLSGCASWWFWSETNQRTQTGRCLKEDQSPLRLLPNSNTRDYCYNPNHHYSSSPWNKISYSNLKQQQEGFLQRHVSTGLPNGGPYKISEQARILVHNPNTRPGSGPGRWTTSLTVNIADHWWWWFTSRKNERIEEVKMYECYREISFSGFCP